MRYDDWIDDDEYPDDKDIEQYGYDSPSDYDPLTIGYYDGNRPRFWTRRRIALLVVMLIILAAFLLPSLLRLS